MKQNTTKPYQASFLSTYDKLYISFIDGHLFIRNKELGCPYSVYKGTMLIVDQQSLYTTSTV
jgi:hypothetical protein